MNLYYDLHIHSALSACGDNDMTPNNIVNMAMLKGLDVIAVTDHNTAGNLRPIQKLADEKGILLLPGMELETEEEIHLLCYFENIEAIQEFENRLKDKRAAMKNRIDIFGNQFIMDEYDNVIEEFEGLLSMSVAISLDKVCVLARELGGVIVPAHVDKTSYSIFSSLGYIPPEYGFTTLELSNKPSASAFSNKMNLQQNYNILQNSDAHYLWDIMEKINFLSNCEKSTKNILNFLKKFTIKS